MEIVEPSFLAVTITPSMFPSCVEETVPASAAGAWASAVATFIKAAAATADKSVVIVCPDIGPSFAGRWKILNRFNPRQYTKPSCGGSVSGPENGRPAGNLGRP